MARGASFLRKPSRTGGAALRIRALSTITAGSNGYSTASWPALSRAIPLVQDLPIGVDPGGADSWIWQDLLASGCTVRRASGYFQSDGQNWGLPPFIPHRLREAGYEPFVRTLRASLRHAGGLRIDHVMGLFRLFWIPRGHAAPPTAPTSTIRADELLAIAALESQRAGALVVGEDLGTVEPRRARASWPTTASYPTGCSGSRRDRRPSTRVSPWPR